MPWELASEDKNRAVISKLTELASYEGFAETGIRNLYEMCKDAVYPLHAARAVISLTPIYGIPNLSEPAAEATELPHHEPASPDPWLASYDAYVWSVQYRQRIAFSFTTTIGRDKGVENVIRARCRVSNADGSPLETYYLMNTHDDRADWFRLSKLGEEPVRLGVDDLLDVLTRFVEQRLEQYRLDLP